MPSINAQGGGQRRPTAQEMAGGIPQNAPMPPPQAMAAPPAPPMPAPAMAPPPQGAPVMGGGMPPVGGAISDAEMAAMQQAMGDRAQQPPNQIDPMMQQALQQRLQQQQQQPQQGGMFMDEGLPSWLQKAYSAIPSPIGFAATGDPWASSRDIYNTLHPGGR